MDDEQDDGLERGDEPLTAKPLSGWEWWPEYQDELIRRRKNEMDQLRALNWAMDRIFDGPK